MTTSRVLTVCGAALPFKPCGRGRPGACSRRRLLRRPLRDTLAKRFRSDDRGWSPAFRNGDPREPVVRAAFQGVCGLKPTPHGSSDGRPP